MTALMKVETPLSERWITRCVVCGYERQVFGTEAEARERAVEMGWKFRHRARPFAEALLVAFVKGPVYADVEVAYCPHCQLLIKDHP